VFEQAHGYFPWNLSGDNAAMQILVTVAFIALLGRLGAALFFMMRDSPSHEGQAERQRAKRMAWALALRVGLSIALFLIVLLSYRMGWIHPTGFAAGQ
jgi:archaellum biogenesis protein FlaJ (TadC family)